jgi:nitroreductase
VNAPFDLSETDRLLSTTRSVRRRLDLERPVEREVILECLDLATQAPTGSNRQGWRWIVVTDPELRASLAEIYRRGALGYLSRALSAAEERGADQDVRVFDSTLYLADKMHDVPALLIPCIDVSHLPDPVPPTSWVSIMGSIFPAVWSFQLALRSRGLGSCLTTLHLLHADEARALLGLPENLMQVAMLPIAYTIGAEFKPADRPPVEDITHWNGW